jgi:nicotinamide riboside transporter PnuC
MDLFLQVWGGGLYLLNKIFFAVAEGRKEDIKRRLRIIGWVVYILGVPAWVIILVGKHDWIAASIEAGGLPAMCFGLYNVWQNSQKPHRGLDLVASSFTYSALLFGVCYSIYDYGGLSSVSQLLEIGVMIGFLLGSYLLAKKHSSGWLFFMLMNVSMASLMFLQHKPLLAVQQLVSLCFVIYGFTAAVRSKCDQITTSSAE